MNEQLVAKVEEALSAISVKIGEGTEHFWPILIEQQVAEGWIALAFVAVFLPIPLVVLLVGVCRGWVEQDVTYRGILTIAAGSAAFFGWLGVLANGTSIITKITNPEYHALKTILEAL